jgi:hypothetical protein
MASLAQPTPQSGTDALASGTEQSTQSGLSQEMAKLITDLIPKVTMSHRSATNLTRARNLWEKTLREKIAKKGGNFAELTPEILDKLYELTTRPGLPRGEPTCQEGLQNPVPVPREVNEEWLFDLAKTIPFYEEGGIIDWDQVTLFVANTRKDQFSLFCYEHSSGDPDEYVHRLNEQIRMMQLFLAASLTPDDVLSKEYSTIHAFHLMDLANAAFQEVIAMHSSTWVPTPDGIQINKTVEDYFQNSPTGLIPFFISI